MCRRFLLLIFSLLGTAPLSAESPRVLEEGMSIERFAGSDLIKTPTGLVFTGSGKLLVIESNTHFRPEGYEGPENDQIVWLKDTDGDGVADTRSVFYDTDLVATMDIAVHPDTGAIYVATRNEILRLWDEDHDGVADEDRIERRLVFLETEGTYPHDGCSGITFDDLGNLIFGIGENLGYPYVLKGSDGREISDHGEGGNIWWCDAAGGSLQRYSTGFWNPFGICHAPGGFVFATDNDPGSRPPSRLHFTTLGADHGFQFRYGRSGQHPFISWNGELPGTRPMLHGTGEAPCDVIYHEGYLYVASWADRRIERYPLSWVGTHFETNQEIMIQGDGDFRPVAFAVSPQGDLYCSDWVKSDYTLHGEGAVWKITGWESEPRPMPGAEDRIALMKAPVEGGKIADPGYWSDPWLTPALINTMGGKRTVVLGEYLPDPGDESYSAHQRALMLLAWRKNNPEDPTELSIQCLSDPDPTVQLLALKWISDEEIHAAHGAVEAIAKRPPSPELFLAAITALARLDGEALSDKAIQRLIGKELKKKNVTPEAKRAGFLVLGDRENFLSVEELKDLYSSADIELKIDVMLTLLVHPDREGAMAFASEVRDDASTPARVLRFAREAVGRSAMPVSGVESYPPATDLEGWKRFLDEVDLSDRDPEDVRDQGRVVFHRYCASCHQADGFGRLGGPNLSTIHERGIDHLLRSILDPGAEVAPQYEPWLITLEDRSSMMGFLLGQKGGNSVFADINGEEFIYSYKEIIKREQVSMSLMPPGLLMQMSKADIKALIEWLSTGRE
ncbi:MAG: c-type cytochrome [Verrucomicrobiales bacterium]|nr:c-type cytochrome [Verrucomicrobiales bacterium]